MAERDDEGGNTQEADPINGKVSGTSSLRAGSASHRGSEADSKDARVRGARAVLVARGTMSATGFEAAHACAARLHPGYLGR